jgi:hypothetical protein
MEMVETVMLREPCIERLRRKQYDFCFMMPDEVSRNSQVIVVQLNTE